MARIVLQRARVLHYVYSSTIPVQLDGVFYAWLALYLAIVGLALAIGRRWSGEARRIDSGAAGRVLFWLLAAAALGILAWRRLRYLDHIGLGIDPEVLAHLANGRIQWERIQQGHWTFAWSYNTGIDYVFALWAQLMGWGVHSYKILQALFTLFVMATTGLLFALVHGRRASVGAALVVAMGGSAYLGAMYRMKWHTLVPVTQALVLIFFYLGERRSRWWRLAALATAAVAAFLYAGCIVHGAVLGAYYGLSLAGRLRRAPSWRRRIGPALLLLSAGLLVGGLFFFAHKIGAHYGYGFLGYFVNKAEIHNKTGAFQSIFREIWGRGLTPYAGLLFSLGIFELARRRREPMSRILLLYTLATAAILIPTHGYENYDENAFIIIQLTWTLALGAMAAFELAAFMLRPLADAAGAAGRVLVPVACCAAIAVPYVAGEEDLFWRHYIGTVQPDPRTVRFQTVIGLIEAADLMGRPGVRVFLPHHASKDPIAFEYIWHWYFWIGGFEVLKRVNMVMDLDQFLEEPPGPNVTKVLFLAINQDTRRSLAKLVRDGQGRFALESVGARAEPWLTRFPAAKAYKLTWHGDVPGAAADRADPAGPAEAPSP